MSEQNPPIEPTSPHPAVESYFKGKKPPAPFGSLFPSLLLIPLFDQGRKSIIKVRETEIWVRPCNLNGETIGLAQRYTRKLRRLCVYVFNDVGDFAIWQVLLVHFRGAASSVSLWGKKLPPNYQDLLDLLPPERNYELSSS